MEQSSHLGCEGLADAMWTNLLLKAEKLFLIREIII